MAAANLIVFSTPTRRINERSAMTVVARFRDRATNADVTPTNCKYRLDSECGQVTDWTTLTPGTTATIALTSTQTQIVNGTRILQDMVLSVAADYALATQFIECMPFQVRNQPYYA